MKKHILAFLLLLVIALTACTSAPTEAEDDTREKRVFETAEATETETAELTEATEEVTEETEATEETLPEPAELDLGVIDGNTYRNESLGISCAFSDDWYIYNETDIASMNKYIISLYDNEAITEAIESGQTVIIFAASNPATMTSVQIAVSKSKATTADESEILRFITPMLLAQLEQSGVMTNIASDIVEAEFCGQTHAALSITGESMGMQLYDTLLYLTRGDIFYGLSVTTTQESMIAESLAMFEAIEE